jgi:uncharacterized protein (UPF0548 family)
MASKLTLRRQVATAGRWPVGVLLTSWRYMWRTTPMQRREQEGDPSEDCPPALPPAIDRRELQGPAEGVGPLFRRRYQAHICGSKRSSRELMSEMQRDLDAFAPSEFASFQRVIGEPGRMWVGDEYVVRMPGPWDGPVRVLDVTPTSFRLGTLEGHLEAGQIEFRIAGSDPIVFTIESWARSGDPFSDLLFDRLRMAKEVQLHMWTSVLERVVKRSGGRRLGCLEVDTRRLEKRWPAERLTQSTRKRRALAALDNARLNFDRSRRNEFTPMNGWCVDERLQQLISEPPGPPTPAGTWKIARRVMSGYEFADPSIVRAFYDPEAPLEGRNMLLELRFWGLRFWAGVRVTDVYERLQTLRDRPLQVWGWSYATLEGHLERGEMSWEVRKWLDTGAVEFRIHTYSQRAQIRNPLVRFGFRIFGRREQERFYDITCARMLELTKAALRPGSDGAVRRVADELTARPISRAGALHDELARNLELSGEDE